MYYVFLVYIFVCYRIRLIKCFIHVMYSYRFYFFFTYRIVNVSRVYVSCYVALYNCNDLYFLFVCANYVFNMLCGNTVFFYISILFFSVLVSVYVYLNRIHRFFSIICGRVSICMYRVYCIRYFYFYSWYHIGVAHLSYPAVVWCIVSVYLVSFFFFIIVCYGVYCRIYSNVYLKYIVYLLYICSYCSIFKYVTLDLSTDRNNQSVRIVFVSSYIYVCNVYAGLSYLTYCIMYIISVMYHWLLYITVYVMVYLVFLYNNRFIYSFFFFFNISVLDVCFCLLVYQLLFIIIGYVYQ